MMPSFETILFLFVLFLSVFGLMYYSRALRESSSSNPGNRSADKTVFLGLLKGLVKSKHGEVREWAAESAGRIGGKDGIDLLRGLVEEEDVKEGEGTLK